MKEIKEKVNFIDEFCVSASLIIDDKCLYKSKKEQKIENLFVHENYPLIHFESESNNHYILITYKVHESYLVKILLGPIITDLPSLTKNLTIAQIKKHHLNIWNQIRFKLDEFYELGSNLYYSFTKRSAPPYKHIVFDDNLHSLRDPELNEIYLKRKLYANTLDSHKEELDTKNKSSENVYHPKLSDTVLNDRRYKLVSAIAIITRNYIDKGMQKDIAYSTSDFYINKLDRLTELADFNTLYLDFVQQMNNLYSQYNLSKSYESWTVNKAIEIVQHQLYDPDLSVAYIADKLQISNSYLSSHFKSNTGFGLSKFILEKKIDESMNLLENTELYISEISNMLNFSSQSHFTENFKKVTNTTPAKYRAGRR